MSFIRLNGWAVELKSCVETLMEVGSRSQAFDGNPMIDRRAIKRVWKCRTKALQEMTAEALKGIVAGRGFLWPFNETDYSHKGVGADNAELVAYRINGADGDPAYDENNIAETKWGNGCICVYPGVTNILDADSRDAENGTNGFNAENGATLATNATHYWQGAASVKVSTDAVGADIEGVYTDGVAGSNGVKYYGSVYIKGDAGGEIVSVYLKDVDNAATGTAVDKTLTNANTWYRVACNITLTGDTTDLRLYVVEKSADSDIDFYVDGCQIEAESVMDAPTAWYDGTRANSRMRYNDNPDMRPVTTGMTINMWVKQPTTATGDHDPYLVYISLNSTSYSNDLIQLERNASSNDIAFKTSDSDGNTQTDTYSTTPWDNDWHMLTAVIRQNPETGENTKELYIDGASVDSTASTAYIPDFSKQMQVFDLFGGNYANYLGHGVEDLLVVPYAAPSGLVSAWYAMGVAMPTYPRVYVDGDVMPDTTMKIEATPRLIGATKMQGGLDGDGTWRNNLQEVEFELEEWVP